MKIDIIIPNFNGADLIEKNLPHVIQSLSGYDGKIILVDDGSEDNDLLKLKALADRYKSKVILVEHKENKGFSSAINSGIKHSNSQFIAFLNSDVTPRKNFLDSPIKHLLGNEKLFAVGCMDESIEDGKIVLRGRGLSNWKNGMLNHKKGEIDKENTFWVSGGSSVLRRDLLIKLGGMDEIYNPFYWEDIDLSYRAQKMGYILMFDRNSIVRHQHEEGAIKKNFNKNNVTTVAYRNQFIFIWKNINNSTLFMNHLIYLPINIFGAIKRRDLNFFYGLFLAVLKLPAIIVKRIKQKKYYKVSDVEIINSIS